MDVDASATHVDRPCLVQQLHSKRHWLPVGFFSKKLETAHQNYSATPASDTSGTCWMVSG